MVENLDCKEHKSGYVAIVGKPNVGKSTLMNALLEQKVAAVSVRPQTTRKRQLGILTRKEAQIIFVDTPGLHKPDYKLSSFINSEAIAALHDADTILFLVDGSKAPDVEDQKLASEIRAIDPKIPVIIALNKCETVGISERELRAKAFYALLDKGSTIEISALRNQNLGGLISVLIETLPVGPEFFPTDQVTDYFERDIASDLIREACLNYLEDEIPHTIAVRIDEYQERSDSGGFISATIFVERESHKGMVIGKRGEMLKKIGTMARQEIETMSDRKIFLELRVKVAKNWRNDKDQLKRFGYTSQGGIK
ncbi:MAG: GTPase Era [Anaerolineaceae bacterium]|nr:GTPase Era [Anaerolineaceae bacterium]